MDPTEICEHGWSGPWNSRPCGCREENAAAVQFDDIDGPLMLDACPDGGDPEEHNAMVDYSGRCPMCLEERKVRL